MKFNEAFQVIIDEGDVEHACRPFCLYSRLADLVGADYCERDKVNLLFRIDRRLFLVKRVMENTTEVAQLRDEFSALRDVGSGAECGKILDMVASFFIEGYVSPMPDEPNDFDYGCSDGPQAEEETDENGNIEDCLNDRAKLMRFTVVQLREYCRVHGRRGYSSRNKTQLVDLIMGQTEKAGTPATPQRANSVSYGGYSGVEFSDVLPWLGGAIGIAILIVGAVCLDIFANRIPWNVWQWIIGAGGGLLVCGVGFLIALAIGWFLEEVILTGFNGYRMAIPAVIAPLVIANFVLMLVFKEIYFVIFYWMSGYLLLASVAGAVYSFSDYETASGIFGIVDAIAVAGMLAAQILMQVL